MLLVPVRAHSSTPRNTNLDTTHMTKRTTSNLASHLLKINNHGVSSQAEAGEKVVVEVALVHLIFQRPAVV